MVRSAPLKLPLIDVAKFKSNTWYPAIDQACRQWGCFQIVNHGIDSTTLNNVLELIRRFFELPKTDKLAIERTGDNAWGFYDRELTKNVQDWKEIFDYGPPVDTGPMCGSRPQWPTNLPDFEHTVRQFYQIAEGVASHLLAAISSNLGMPADHLSSAFEKNHSSFLRLNCYPLCETPTKHLGISPHSDAGALTVLLASAEPGLQFMHQGNWCTASPIADALTINIGDIVQVWSNNRYIAPLHRVLANSQAKRYSAPFFYNPSYQTNYAPLPALVSEQEPAHYQPINWGDFRAARAAGDYADNGEEIQISQFRN